MRVLAIESMKEGVMRSYGEGEYIGDKVPDIVPFNQPGLKNPCVKLDNGKHVWGFQCWWGEVAKVREHYDIKEEILVEIEEDILPVESN